MAFSMMNSFQNDFMNVLTKTTFLKHLQFFNDDWIATGNDCSGLIDDDKGKRKSKRVLNVTL